MDKTKEMRRGASLFSPTNRQFRQSGQKLASDVDLLEKSKKEKIRGLNAVVDRASSSNEDSEIGVRSEGEDEQFRLPLPPPNTNGNSSKRLKIHRKTFDKCNPVDPAAVPRKLRSAMNKRNCESTSPPLPDAKKLHRTFNGIESSQLKNVKKTKQNMKQEGNSEWSPRLSISGPVTKDEEDVAATLFAMARMFPNSEPVKNRMDPALSEAKSYPLPETRESSMPASEAPEVERTKSPTASITAEAANLSSSIEGSPGETVKIKPLINPTVLEQLTAPKGQRLDMVSKSSAAQVDLQGNSLFSKIECTVPSCDAASLGAPPELCLETRLTQPKQHEAALPESRQELFPGAAVATKQEHQHPMKENKESGIHHALREGGPALWPGLSTSGSFVGEVHGPSARSSSAKAPAWLDTATCATRPSSSSNGVSTEKVSSVKVGRSKSWKRCVTHVYISCLIKDYQTAEDKRRWPVPPNQLKLNGGSKSNVVTANDPTGLRSSLHEVIASSNINGSAVGKNLNEARNGFLVDNRLQQDQQASTTSGINTLQKQSCDFLSLSPGGGRLEDNSNNQAGNNLEPSAQRHIPYLHSLVQHHPLMPISFSHTRYSSPYSDQLMAAAAAQQVQMQLPQYLGSPFYGPPHLGHAGSAKQQQESQQQQHHQQLVAHLAAQYRSRGIPGSHLPKWQIGRHDSPSLIPSAQPIFSTSPPLEVVSTKFSPNAQQQQQQQLFAISSPSSSTRGKRHHHHIPGSYDEGSSHMPLLCNVERL